MRVQRRLCVMVTAFLLVLLAVPFLALNARADGIGIISPGLTYIFSDATGCATTGAGQVWTDARCDVATKSARAYAWTWNTGLGATATARVWKVVQLTQSVDYMSTTMTGHWWAIVSAAGGAVSEVSFYLRVMNLDTGQLVTQVLFANVYTAVLWASNQQGDFSAQVTWSGTAGYHYGIEAYIQAYTAGVVGSAIADGLSHGLYYTSISITVPGGGGGGCGPGCHIQ